MSRRGKLFPAVLEKVSWARFWRTGSADDLQAAMKVSAARFERTHSTAGLDAVIRLGRNTVAATPAGHPTRAGYLHNLGLMLRVRSLYTYGMADLDEAIDLGRQAVAITPTDDPDRTGYLNDLWDALLARFGRTGSMADLDTAIEFGRRAVADTPASHADRTGYLSNLAAVLQTRFERAGRMTDLNEAIDVCRQAVAATPAGHARRATRFSNLAIMLRARFERTRSTADLDEVILSSREAVAATPAGHPDRAKYLISLALMLRIRFELSGHMADLDEAIDVGREAVAATPADGPDRGEYLNILGSMLAARVEHSGSIADREAAVETSRQGPAAIASQPGDATYLSMPEDTQTHWTGSLADLDVALAAYTFLQRYRDAGREADIAEAVGLFRRALAACADDDPIRSHIANDFAGALLSLFEITGQRSLLDEAIGVLRPAGADDAGTPGSGNNLGVALLNLFECTGERATLDQAIEAFRSQLANGDGDTGTVNAASNLGRALLMLFEQTGEQMALDAAIDVQRQAVTVCQEDDASKAGLLGNLGNSLLVRFGHIGELADLREAVDLFRASLAAIPDGHPEQPGHLSNLGMSLFTLYRRANVESDLDEAIGLLHRAVTATPAGHPQRGVPLSNLGLALNSRFDRTNELADIDGAVAFCGQAVEATAEEHPDRPGRLSNLASALQDRFRLTGQETDLEQAIGIFRRAIAALPETSSHHASILVNLGNALRALFEHGEQPEVLEEAITAYRAVAIAEAAPPITRVLAARYWGQTAACIDWHRATEAFALAVDLLPRVAPRNLVRTDQENGLGQLAGLAAEAAACALHTGDAGLAVTLLEHGRGVLITQSLETREDLSDLEADAPELAARFIELRDLLDTPDRASPSESPLSTHWPSRVDPVTDAGHRRSLIAAWSDLIREIREMPGGKHANFLKPPPLSDLLRQAADGPFILINISSYRSDALILSPDAVTTVPLPDLSPQTVAERAGQFHSAVAAAHNPQASTRQQLAADLIISQVLAWLWDAVTGPVLDHLELPGAHREDEDWPHIWWSPVGLLSYLPLHAAGHHDERGTMISRTVLDRAISSYAPTVRALAYARRQSQPLGMPPRGPVPTTPGQKQAHAVGARMLIVAMPRTPAAPDLPSAQREATLLAAMYPNSVVLTGENATYANVCARLHASDLVHFACHGLSDWNDPSQSHLLLQDHQTSPLTVADISRLHLTSPRLAYLSACSTARTSPRLIDEAIHITAAFQLAGYPHVVGTLWSIRDDIAVNITAAVYAALQATPATGQLQTEKISTALHEAIRSLRDTYPAMPNLWAAHIHIGA